MAKKPTAAAPPAPPTPPTTPIVPETLPPPKPPAEPRRNGRNWVLDIDGREILKFPDRCERCGAAEPAWRDLTAEREVREAREAYAEQLRLFGAAAGKLREPQPWSTQGLTCDDCRWRAILGARNKPLQRLNPEGKRLRKELQALRETPGFGDSARMRARELEIMGEIDRVSPTIPETRVPLGPNVDISYHLAAGITIPEAWTAIEVRHANGDWGKIGQLDGPGLSPQQRFCPSKFDRRVRNLAAMESGRGLVVSRFDVAYRKDGAGKPQPEEIEVTTMLGLGTLAYLPRLDHVHIS